MTARPPSLLLVSNLRLAAVLTAVSCARMYVRRTLDYWKLPDHIDAAELVMSELVTNAVKATGLTDPDPKWEDIKAHHIIGVQLRVIDTRLYVEVWDNSAVAPTKQDVTDDAESGRGLLLVELSSRRWGTFRPPAGGKIVWAELELSKSPDLETAFPILPRRVSGAGRLPKGASVELVEAALLERVLVGLRERL
ncbi:ATP-binding protein [Streptomyces sp. NPDC056835]|uniref:ATP-binding protein n=1 Tax=Streptomyces sp. NPDC056835 TaxID=3345956 RepID=UPI0036791979